MCVHPHEIQILFAAVGTCEHFSVDVCVADHVLEVYSFDSIALHMDRLNQIPQTQWRVMFNGAEVSLQRLLREKTASFSDDVYMYRRSSAETTQNPGF